MSFPLVTRFARSMIYPGCPVAMPAAEALARAYPGVTRFGYATPDGPELVGAWARSGKADAPVLLYFHGNAESAAQNVPMAADLAGRGLDVVLVEYRGYGGLPGSPFETGLYEDAQAALDAVLARDVSPARIALVGRSLGTGVASELAHRGHGKALVLVSPYTSMVDMGRLVVGPMAALLMPDRFDTARKVPDLAIRVTVIHGTQDEVIPFEQGRTVASLAKQGLLCAVDGASHNDIPGLEDQIVRAVAKAFPSR